MAVSSLFKSKIGTLKELYLHQLRDLYDVEQQIIKALPKMIEATTAGDLRSAFEQHLNVTKIQKERLERVFELLGEKPSAETCKGIRGILEEGEELLNRMEEGAVRDAGLITAAQRVEHYEIAVYGTARTYAQILGQQEAVRLLQQSLDEEGETDKTLTRIAEGHRNLEAKQSS